MSTEEILAILAQIVSEVVPGVEYEQVAMEDTLVGDLGVDELTKVDIVYASEEEFGIEIADEDARTLSTVAEFVDYISEKLNDEER
ncbi:MAG: phosphopantetheine-binding protein [Propionibacteriaceae bacterium]|jgi:acyl carrier protein|nr:phosphopantetheine-binding protein [Propionibacteriaceae bacterium]